MSHPSVQVFVCVGMCCVCFQITTFPKTRSQCPCHSIRLLVNSHVHVTVCVSRGMSPVFPYQSHCAAFPRVHVSKSRYVLPCYFPCYNVFPVVCSKSPCSSHCIAHIYISIKVFIKVPGFPSTPQLSKSFYVFVCYVP